MGIIHIYIKGPIIHKNNELPTFSWIYLNAAIYGDIPLARALGRPSLQLCSLLLQSHKHALLVSFAHHLDNFTSLRSGWSQKAWERQERQ